MASGQTQPALHLSQVQRRYPQGDTFLEVLRGAELAIWPGEIVALVAPSGTGKSTLLHVAGLLEKPDGGEVFVGGQPSAHMSDKDLTRVRREELGFVYQFHHLLPEFSALENVVMPQLIRGLQKAEAQDRAKQLLTFLGLGKRLTNRPGELSGGEQQRVAIARATAPKPGLIFADEPTGNLDARTGTAILDLLFERQRATGATLLVITHDPALAARCDRVLEMQDGRIVSDSRR